jgi:hypothetical protein
MRLAIRASPASRLSIYLVFWGLRDNQSFNIWVIALLTSKDVEIDEIRRIGSVLHGDLQTCAGKIRGMKLT